jgi:hypothetical protein
LMRIFSFNIFFRKSDAFTRDLDVADTQRG